MKHVLDITDLSVEEIGRLITVAEDIIRNAEQYQDICKRKKLAALFFEPSTRTRLSNHRTRMGIPILRRRSFRQCTEV